MKYLIKTSIGLFLIEGDTPLEAWSEFVTTDEAMTKDWFITRKQLLARNIIAIKSTNIVDVWELIEEAIK